MYSPLSQRNLLEVWQIQQLLFYQQVWMVSELVSWLELPLSYHHLYWLPQQRQEPHSLLPSQHILLPTESKATDFGSLYKLDILAVVIVR